MPLVMKENGSKLTREHVELKKVTPTLKPFEIELEM